MTCRSRRSARCWITLLSIVSPLRLLFDRNIPDPLARHLTGFVVRRTQDEGRNTLKNGELLDVAEQARFFAMLSADQNLKHQQNLLGRRLALVVLSTPKWTELRNQISAVQAALDAAASGGYVEVKLPRPPLRRRIPRPHGP
jgi:hypothetical protein